MSWGFVFDDVVLWLLVGQLFLILWNLRAMRRPRGRAWASDAPMISVLVPARNEEAAIELCLHHLRGQDYPNLEIIVLDDGSDDATAALVRSVKDQRVRLVAGQPLPTGWTGKNWACHQLSQAAKGDLLCFVDADTLLEAEAVSAAAGVLEEHGAGFVSLMPRADASSLSGEVLLPMVTHAMLALIPVSLINNARNPSLALAFGPFILVSRAAYGAAGGHAANPTHIVDDVQLSREVKAAGHGVRLANGTDLVQTRWYPDVRSIWGGFSKNAYGALGYNPLVGLAALFLLTPLLLAPTVRLVLGLLGAGGVSQIVLIQLIFLLGNRAITSLVGRDPLWSIPLHGVTVAFWAATLTWSMVLSRTGRMVTWKGRAVSAQAADQTES